MIEGKLGKLVGRSSGYIESLPAPVRRRITGLRGVQKEHSKLEAQFQEEVLQLEKKYFAKFTPLYEKRAKIVNGLQEPTEDEVSAGKEDEDSDTEDAKEKKEESTEAMTGVPEFWLSAMKNNALLAETITERDEAALKHLTDIRLSYLDTPGFKLHFVFAENEFFTNKEITKTYYYQDENGYGGDFIYDHAEGDKINWKEGKDLTVRIESKKQRNKSKPLPILPLVYSCITNYFKLDQTPSKPVSSSGLFLQKASSTSSPHLSPPPTLTRTMRTRMISRTAWSSITSLVRTSRRNSSPVPSTGSPARLVNLREWVVIWRASLMTRTMRRRMI